MNSKILEIEKLQKNIKKIEEEIDFLNAQAYQKALEKNKEGVRTIVLRKKLKENSLKRKYNWISKLKGIKKVLQKNNNKFSTASNILAKPLGMSAENEEALEKQANALIKNIASTPSAEHADYLMNMQRGIANATATPATMSPFFKHVLGNRPPKRIEEILTPNSISALATTRKGGKFRRHHKKASRRRITRRRK